MLPEEKRLAGMWQEEESDSQESAFSNQTHKQVQSPSAAGWGHFSIQKELKAFLSRAQITTVFTRDRDVHLPSKPHV